MIVDRKSRHPHALSDPRQSSGPNLLRNLYRDPDAVLLDMTQPDPAAPVLAGAAPLRDRDLYRGLTALAAPEVLAVPPGLPLG